MSRVSMFNSPLLLGFDQLERMLDRLAKSAEGYPPYNIERIGENGLRITLAVAGFTTEDLGERPRAHPPPTARTISISSPSSRRRSRWRVRGTTSFPTLVMNSFCTS